MPLRQVIFEVAGQFELPLSYSIPPARYLENSGWGWLLNPVRWIAERIWIAFERSCRSSLERTRGAVALNTTPAIFDSMRNLGLASSESGALSPAQVHEYLCPKIFDERTLRIERPKNGSLIYHYICSNPDGGAIYAKRILDFVRKEAYHDLLFSDPELTEVSVAEVLLKSSLKFYEHTGISKIGLLAGLTSGGRLWPKYGFRPISSDEWKGCFEIIRRNLTMLSEPIQAHWRDEVEFWLSNTDPRTIWRLSSIKERVETEEGRFKLGDVLLNGTKWRGVLDLDDRLARAQLYTRLGFDHA
jgi:hypothetical protein